MVVCFIGHRTIANTEQLKNRLIKLISNLILNGCDTFLFGSRSDFNSLCWDIVTELQTQFPLVKRIRYNAPHEVAFTSKEELEHYKQIFSKILKVEIHYTDYEKAVNSQKSLRANRATYIIRNEEMIDNSDICVFYYNKNYLPPRRKKSKRDIFDYQPKSGTAIAFAYAKQKNKIILNLYNK